MSEVAMGDNEGVMFLMVDSFIDSYTQNGDIDAAMRLKKMRAALLDGSLRI